jgi:hypothetical protein
VVAAVDGTTAGLATLSVKTPKGSELPAPGDAAVVAATATVDRRRGVRDLCTREPACGMHEVSLHTALRQGRPVVATFATPAYCQTAVCGPSVDTVEKVRTSRDWGDTAFVHVEIYRDAGKTVAEPVEKWRLPSEPWLFTIRADGSIAGRVDGPLLVLPEQVASLVGDISA